MEMPTIVRPTPRRVFERNRTSEDPSPAPESQNPELVLENMKRPDTAFASSRTKSILNLTSSTLLGIYSNTIGDGNREESHTPWGTGTQTPAHRSSTDVPSRPDFSSANWGTQGRPGSSRKQRTMSLRKPRSGFKQYYLPLLWRTCCLFLFGMGFGLLVTQLQRSQQIATVPIPTFARTSWTYQTSWGLLGVLIGNVLPRIDALWDDDSAIEDGDDNTSHSAFTRTRSNASDMNGSLAHSGTGPFWHSAVRSIGVFVGIAFAVRKVPWQSTLQVSLTLAVANPVLWYLIDRSKPGFALSSAVGVVGTFLLLFISPDFVPMPAIHQNEQVSEKLGVYTWLSSILFCTSLCFGAIGRKLQL